MWNYISRFILNNKITLLITLLCVSAFMAYKGKDLQLAYAGSKVLPITDSTYLEYNSFKKRFAEDGTILVIGIDNQKIWEKDIYNNWKILGDEIKQIEGIKGVLSVGSLFKISKNEEAKKFEIQHIPNGLVSSQSELDSIKNEIYSQKFFDGLIFNSKNNATLMAISFDQAVINTKLRGKIVKEIHKKTIEFSEKNDVTLHYSGMPWVRSYLSDKIAKEFVLFLGLALATTGLVLAFFFRQHSAIWFPILVVINGVLWAIGIIALFEYKISLLLGIIPALMVIIGVPNSVLLLNKYHQEFKETGDKIHSLHVAIQKIGPTTFLANLAASIGFGVFSFTNSEILEEFGHVASISIMAVYLNSIILIPIIFAFLNKPTEKQLSHLDQSKLNFFLAKIEFLAFRKRTQIYIYTFIIAIVALYGASKIRTNGYVVDDLPKKDDVYIDLRFFENNFEGVLPLEVSIETNRRNGIMNAAFLKKLEEFQNMVASYPAISRPISINELLKAATQAYYNGNPNQYRLPSSMEQSFILSYISKKKTDSTENNSSNMLKGYISDDKSETRVSFQMADIGSEKMTPLLAELKTRTDSIFSPDKYTVTFTGSSRLFVKGTDYMVYNLKESLLMAIILISAIIFYLFRSPKMNLIALAPNILSLIVTAGIMGFAGISLKPSTILIYSIAFGLANDQTIYLLSKYRQERSLGAEIPQSVAVAIRETGMSMIYVAGVLFFGFGIFTASNFEGTMWLGILVSMTLLVALFSNLLLVPALLLTTNKEKK